MTSIQILDCFTIVFVMGLARTVLKTQFGSTHLLGAVRPHPLQPPNPDPLCLPACLPAYRYVVGGHLVVLSGPLSPLRFRHDECSFLTCSPVWFGYGFGGALFGIARFLLNHNTVATKDARAQALRLCNT